MKLNNKKWLVLLPMAMILSLFLLTVFVYITYKDHQMNFLEKNYQEAIKTNVESGKQDILAKINDRKSTTNPKFLEAWKWTYDDGTWDTYNTINNFVALDTDEWVTSLEATQLLDKIVTNRTTSVTRLWEYEPSKKNNVFEIDLVNFLKNDWSLKNNLILWDLKLYWWTVNTNTPDMYIVMSRIKKNSTITLDTAFEVAMAKKNFWSLWQYWTSWVWVDNMAVDYKRIVWWACWSYLDVDIPDPSFRWCKKTDLFDILSNTNLDLNNYIYKVFIVFWQTDTGDSETPFKVFSDVNWTFWVWNFVQADVTMMTWENVKKRVFINTATKNNILPYLVYSLWVKWKIEMENEDS